MPDGMEAGLMDKELEEAQKLTKEDLLDKLEKGRPAALGEPPRDLNQRAKSVVDRAVTRSEQREATRTKVRIVASGSSVEPITENSQAPASGPLLDQVIEAE